MAGGAGPDPTSDTYLAPPPPDLHVIRNDDAHQHLESTHADNRIFCVKVCVSSAQSWFFFDMCELRPVVPLPFAPLLRAATLGAFAFAILRLVLFSPLFRRVAIRACPNDPLARSRCFGALRRGTIHAWTCALVVGVSGGELFGVYHDTTLFWTSWPSDMDDASYASYVAYLAAYIHHLVDTQFHDVRGSDYHALLFHHVVVVVALLGSYTMRFTTIAVFTMTLFDGSDVLLELAKCFNYAQAAHPSVGILADASFALFALSFAFFRLYVFPVCVIRSVLFEACARLACFAPTGFAQCMHTWTAAFFVPLLLALWGLQVFWFAKIAQVIRKALQGVPLNDPRDDE